MRLQKDTTPPPIPLETPSNKKFKIIGYSVVVLVFVYIYVFFYSPASCNNVKKKIKTTVNENSKEHIKAVVRGRKKKIADFNGNSLNLNLPSSVTGDYSDELLDREFLLSRTVTGHVKRREKFTNSLVRNGLALGEAKRIVATFESRGVFNFRRAQPGQKFTIKMSLDGSKAFHFRYNYGHRTILIAERTSKGFKVKKIRHPLILVVYGIGFTIGKSLASSLSGIGENYSLGKKLIALFSDEIQGRELVRGDEIKLLVEKKLLKTKPVGYGNILAVMLNSREKGKYKVYYNKQGGYYTSDGISFFRTFLRRPLGGNTPPEKDSKNSGLVYPASKKPVVWALSGGVITELGWAGALGRRVEILHTRNIRTIYYHLSKISKKLKKGKIVSRHQIIGRAGFSGTTPDKNGVGLMVLKGSRKISPLVLSSLREDPIRTENLPEFRKSIKIMDKQLSLIDISKGGVSKRILEFGVKKAKKKLKRSKKRRKRRRKHRRRRSR